MTDLRDTICRRLTGFQVQCTEHQAMTDGFGGAYFRLTEVGADQIGAYLNDLIEAELQRLRETATATEKHDA